MGRHRKVGRPSTKNQKSRYLYHAHKYRSTHGKHKIPKNTFYG
jgi:hypothetical protein